MYLVDNALIGATFALKRHIQFIADGTAATQSLDVESLFSGSNAADAGGPLAQINNAVSYYGNGAVTILRNLGIFLMVASVVILGIAFAWKSGDAQGQAENKKRVFPVLIGIVLVVGAIGVVSLIASVGMNLTSKIPS